VLLWIQEFHNSGLSEAPHPAKKFWLISRFQIYNVTISSKVFS
jgi:hypothetical protein